MANRYNQEEEIDYDKIYASVARLKAIRSLLAFACYMNFKLFQINMKNIFLNDYITEEIFAEQPPRFKDHLYPNHVFNWIKLYMA